MKQRAHLDELAKARLVFARANAKEVYLIHEPMACGMNWIP